MIDIKIDTKEKFTVLNAACSQLTANMTDDLQKLFDTYYTAADKPHIIFNLCEVTSVDNEMANFLAAQQQKFYDANHSFVLCCLQADVENTFDELELLEVLNVTPTESEAWDIVQMEEIERELLG